MSNINQQCNSLMNDTYIGADGLARCSVCNEARETDKCIPGTDTPMRVLCKCQRESIKKEEDLKRFKDEQKYFKKLQEASLLGARYKDARFEHTEIISENFKNALDRCKKYCDCADEVLNNGYGIYLHGTPGVGKTHLTACMCNKLISMHKQCLFTSFIEISKRIKNAFYQKENNSDFVDKICSVDFLFIDDIGTERLRTNGEDSWIQEQIFDIINKRYNNQKPTVFSSNHSIRQLVEDRGLMEKTADRILEMSKDARIKLEGDSYRHKNTNVKVPF